MILTYLIFKKKNIKNMHLQVKPPDGQVFISAPSSMDDKAIEVCETAIRLGYIDDGTEGQMPGRIARLIRKKGKTLPSIKSSQHIVVENETDEK